jgi:hypothetical protein
MVCYIFKEGLLYNFKINVNYFAYQWLPGISAFETFKQPAGLLNGAIT